MQITDLEINTKVKKILKETRGLNISTVAKEIGMSHTGFAKSLDKGTLGLDEFLKMCAVIGKPVLEFIPFQPYIDEEGELQLNLNQAAPTAEMKKKESKQVLKLKDELIEKQNTIIELMKEMSELKEKLASSNS